MLPTNRIRPFSSPGFLASYTAACFTTLIVPIKLMSNIRLTNFVLRGPLEVKVGVSATIPAHVIATLIVPKVLTAAWIAC